MDVLRYNDLDLSGIRKEYDALVHKLQINDFEGAQLKKLHPTPYYRAKLDYANRLLLKIVQHEGQKVALILELIPNHAYERSRFLRGVAIEESKIQREPLNAALLDQEPLEPMPHLRPTNQHFHILDKILCFDPSQEDVFHLEPPLIIIGSAGSGKTLLTLEKMKQCAGEILYVSQSNYLVQNARSLYYAHHYSNEAQAIDFLSYEELLQSLQIPQGRPIDFNRFATWIKTFHDPKRLAKAHPLYEEFKGVITGNTTDKPYLSREDYLGLGIKQSIFSLEERPWVYESFEKYLRFLSEQKLYDLNLLSFDYLSHCQGHYDAVIVDEVQDLTPIQLHLILKTLKSPQNFILCGDSNQIVHPNFFSWSKLKTFFYQQSVSYPAELIRALNKNYRNAQAITQLANQILKLKNTRFGSIDKESHFLVESLSPHQGAVYSCLAQASVYAEFNQKTAQSTHVAVLVLNEAQKQEAAQHFKTPLIFTIQEAKGLEYDHVILYHFISHESQAFRAIAASLNPSDLEAEWRYGRTKDKADHSLEIYKFYINALYVGITRAIKNVYLIEAQDHPLLALLALSPSQTLSPLENQRSSLEEWQKEAHRLELQGKQQQAEAIRQSVLGIKKTPWTPLTGDELKTLCTKAFNTQTKDKAARLLLFEYALLHHAWPLLEDLQAIGFFPSSSFEKSFELLTRKYFLLYTSSNIAGILQQLKQYGVDFRDRFNYTPLMLACRFGNSKLASELIDQGANLKLENNLGQTPFQILLQQALWEPKFAQRKLEALYERLAPGSLDLEIEGKLLKIDAQRLEFLLVQTMMNLNTQKNQVLALKAGHFLNAFLAFPESILPERRKKRAYISSLLAKHEVQRQDPYNRKLFLRVGHGTYSLNPKLKLRTQDLEPRLEHE